MIELPVFIETDRSWADNAACKGLPLDMFFPPGKLPAPPEAREACKACPVALECAIYALEHNQHHGLWGGLNIRQRRKIGLAELLRRKDERDARV